MKNLSVDVTLGVGRASHTAAMLSAVRTALARLYSAWIVRRRYTQGMRDLQAFADRELSDLGLNRCDVSAIVRGAYRRN